MAQTQGVTHLVQCRGVVDPAAQLALDLFTRATLHIGDEGQDVVLEVLWLYATVHHVVLVVIPHGHEVGAGEALSRAEG